MLLYVHLPVQNRIGFWDTPGEPWKMPKECLRNTYNYHFEPWHIFLRQAETVAWVETGPEHTSLKVRWWFFLGFRENHVWYPRFISETLDTVVLWALILLFTYFKLKQHSLDGAFVKRIYNWLDHHEQGVVINGSMSAWEGLLSCVSQMVILGLVPFSIFINNLKGGTN